MTRAVPAGGEPVGLLLRLAAMLYDGLLVLALVFLGTLPLVVLNAGEAIPAHTAWYRLWLLAIVGGYFVFFWTRGAETLGMKSWRIMVVSRDGGPVTVRRAMLRAVTAVLSWLPCGAGFLWSLVDREGLAWHDRISGTKLVRSVKRR
ncbi:RDD family protein [Lentisalinibacter sediminis]|uniref:RDD family protein n=1 Tax=Lentisalinibacter sediminis TaxID=2992237 RepID=UPI00386ECD04